MSTYKTFSCVAAFAVFATACVAALGATQSDSKAQKVVPLDRIVAVVNDDVITQYDLNDNIKLVVNQLNKQGTPLPPQDVLEKQILERLVNDRVQLQFAKETGVRVDDTQLEKTLERIAEGNGMTLQLMHDKLEKEGINFNRFREEIRSEIIMTRLKEREVDSKITVTESEIDNFLRSQEALAGRYEEYEIAHILVLVPEQASPEQIRAKRARAEQALLQIKNGADFAQIAAGYSDATDALQGGVLGWRSSGRLPGIFVEALRVMQVGEVSTILRSANGFHLIKLINKRGSDAEKTIEQTHARHILIKTSELVSDQEARSRLVNLKERLENGEDFGDLARAHSEDGSAPSGGDLGWQSSGDTVPEFERAMQALKTGQISEPVRTQFGWHLIQVLERRKQDITKDQQRLRARQTLRARKADEAHEEWLRQLRDRAYVEYRLEEK